MVTSDVIKSGFGSTALSLFMEFVISRECFQPYFIPRGESLGLVVEHPKE